jgi:hypothetical protein
MKKNRFWLSYDFGIQGDYRSLYSWLDDIGAEDCGDSVASFEINGTREDVIKAIEKVAGLKGRLYLIGRNKEGKVTGGFISGRRKSPPWTGSSNKTTKLEEEEA